MVGFTRFNENSVLKDYTVETYTVEWADVSDELVLVNRDYAYNQEPQQLVHIEKGSSNLIRVMDDMEMQPQVHEAMIDLAEAAVRDGISTLQLNSAYRNAQSQAALFDQHGEEYALPGGHSEHQTGLALDIGVTTGKLKGTDAAKWLEKNAPTYGFVLRYPAHKVDVTDIEFEPWHFRYVGLPHSFIMQEQDFVLEEYLEYVQSEKAMKYVIGMEEYVIQHAETLDLQVPVGSVSQISNNNVDGVIVTTLID